MKKLVSKDLERLITIEDGKATIDGAFLKSIKGYVVREGSLFERPLKDRIAQIEILEEEREVPADPMSMYMTDGSAKNRIAPKGTILKNGKEILKEKFFERDYRPFEDENGKPIKGMYVNCSLKNTVIAIENPLHMPLIEKNGNGYIIAKYAEDCYLVVEHKAFQFSGRSVRIMERQEFEKRYEKSDREIIISEY